MNESNLGEAKEAESVAITIPRPHNWVIVRSGPGSWYGAVTRLYGGRSIDVECWTHGGWVHSTDIWYRLWGGAGYITAAAVTGASVPEC